MGELLPTLAATSLREGLLDYLETTFSLADLPARAALKEFLEHPKDGIFKGPYVRLRLPFQPAAEGWRDTLGWHPVDSGGFPPYGHQAAAYARLSSLASRPRAAASAAYPGDHRHWVRQDRGVPSPDPRPRAAREDAKA